MTTTTTTRISGSFSVKFFSYPNICLSKGYIWRRKRHYSSTVSQVLLVHPLSPLVERGRKFNKEGTNGMGTGRNQLLSRINSIAIKVLPCIEHQRGTERGRKGGRREHIQSWRIGCTKETGQPRKKKKKNSAASQQNTTSAKSFTITNRYKVHSHIRLLARLYSITNFSREGRDNSLVVCSFISSFLRGPVSTDEMDVEKRRRRDIGLERVPTLNRINWRSTNAVRLPENKKNKRGTEKDGKGGKKKFS